MQKICSKCGEKTEHDNDLHCRKIFAYKINELVKLNEIEKAKFLFDSASFDEKWKRSLLDKLKVKSDSGRMLSKLIEKEIQQTHQVGDVEGPHRIARCYDCKESLSSSTHNECTKCHWLICKCGVCGCRYVF